MLEMPYAVDTNDARFWGGQSGPGYTGSTDFFDYLKDTFDTLYAESEQTGKMMSIGLHARIMRPGRAAAIVRFLEYIKSKDEVLIAKRRDLAIAFATKFAPSNTWNWPPSAEMTHSIEAGEL
jgi:peptidoglycan/xylan/chitin deacetylase (PgdA/CDA1 family)